VKGKPAVTDRLEMWFWTINDPVTKRRRQTRHRMTEAEARERHGDDAVKVEGTLEVREVGRDNSMARFQCPPPGRGGG
jgi:hypothetical protein